MENQPDSSTPPGAAKPRFKRRRQLIKPGLQLRFGLDGEDRQTLAEIGRRLEVSRERVRQVELKALRKLRNLTRRLPSEI